jgi:hypothetical protein
MSVRTNASREASVKLAQLEKDIKELKKQEACFTEKARLAKADKNITEAQYHAEQILKVRAKIQAKQRMATSLDGGLMSNSMAHDLSSTQRILNSLAAEKKTTIEAINVVGSKASNIDSRITDRQMNSVMESLYGQEIDEEERSKSVLDLLDSLDVSSEVSTTTTTTTTINHMTTPTTKRNNNNNVSEVDRLLNLI